MFPAQPSISEASLASSSRPAARRAFRFQGQRVQGVGFRVQDFRLGFQGSGFSGVWVFSKLTRTEQCFTTTLEVSKGFWIRGPTYYAQTVFGAQLRAPIRVQGLRFKFDWSVRVLATQSLASARPLSPDNTTESLMQGDLVTAASAHYPLITNRQVLACFLVWFRFQESPVPIEVSGGNPLS